MILVHENWHGEGNREYFFSKVLFWALGDLSAIFESRNIVLFEDLQLSKYLARVKFCATIFSDKT